jgi:hypothetical protein
MGSTGRAYLPGNNLTVRFILPIVHSEGGIVFRVYSNDHPPPHVHAINRDGAAKIELGDEHSPARVVRVDGPMRDREVLKAVRVVEREWRMLLNAWRRVHGQD